jgi:4,5:9,10-diseco-3-hydroxy-5,9,17-trioxoandrosta-1(10),2-diene-4-oate hydrolase
MGPYQVNTTFPVGWRERRISAAGVGITAFEAGSAAPDARTLVLVHGLGHWTQAAWDALVPLLDGDLRIVAFDLPGFGRSEKPKARYDTAFFATVVTQALDALAPGAFALCGHSLGGYVAATYAAAHPRRVERLILIAPAGFLRSPHFVFALLGTQLARWLFLSGPGRRLVEQTLDRSVVDPTSIGPQIRAAAFALAQDPDVRRAFAAVYTGAIADFADTPRIHARLRSWTGRTLIIWGRQDVYIPVGALAGARAVYPQAQVVICERSGHLAMVEEAERVAAAINEFLTA